MARRSSSLSSSGGKNLLSGIFGNFHFGTIVSCDNDDDGLFCKISKLFNGFMMILIFVVILYMLYTYFAPMIFGNKKRRR